MDEQELATEQEDTEATVTLYEWVVDSALMAISLLILLPLWCFLALVYWGDGMEGLA